MAKVAGSLREKIDAIRKSGGVNPYHHPVYLEIDAIVDYLDGLALVRAETAATPGTSPAVIEDLIHSALCGPQPPSAQLIHDGLRAYFWEHNGLPAHKVFACMMDDPEEGSDLSLALFLAQYFASVDA